MFGIAGHAQAGWQSPLSAIELQLATQLVIDANKPQSRSASVSTPSEVRQSPEVLGKEVLLVETLYRKKSTSKGQSDVNTGNTVTRLAEAFVFDYASGQTTRYLLDVASNRIIDQQAVDSIHLPLNQREQDLAAKLAIDNASVAASVSTEFLREYGKEPQFDIDIETKTFIWQPPPGDKSRLADECRQQRCAWVSLFTSDSLSLSVEPVVNLMQRKIYLRSEAK